MKVTCNPGNFGGQSHSGSGDMFLVYHMISQDHMIKGSCDFMSGIPLL